MKAFSTALPFAQKFGAECATSGTGTVYLVGAGPGDPELLTVKAQRLIRTADALVHDHLVPAQILKLGRVDAERVFVGKKGGGFCCPQRDIEGTLIRLARAGKNVVRLKGGDPFIFGRGGEEAEALVAAGIAFEIVPGVTSALAAAAYAGIPLTHRAHSSAVVFLTGHEDPNKPDSAIRWEDYGRLGATLCVYMGMKNLETITRRLVAGGLPDDTPAAVIQSATTGEHRQLVSTAGKVALESEHAGFGAPAIVVIGPVAALSEKLAWFTARLEKRPAMIVALIDNGSLEPAAHRNLRSIAQALSARTNVNVRAVSWKHSDRIADRDLDGVPAWTLAPFIRSMVALGQREFVFVPFFISAQGAIGSALRRDLHALNREVDGFELTFTEGLVDRGVVPAIVAERIRFAATQRKLSFPPVVVVDHGGPAASSAVLRDQLTADIRERLGREVGPVAAASMEGAHGPLLGEQLRQPKFNQGDVLVAPLFLSPGRHAGPGGDLETICRTSSARCHLTELVGTHPLAVDALAGALRTSLTTRHAPFFA